LRRLASADAPRANIIPTAARESPMHHRLLLLPLATLAFATSGAAQGMSNPAQWYINNSIYSTRVFNSTVGTSTASRTAGARTGSGRAAPAPAERDVTRFTERPNSPLPALLAANSTGISASPAEAQRRFASYIALYKKTAQQDGFPANDLAYAFEYFVVNNYQIHHDLVTVPYEKDPWALRAIDGFDRIAAMSKKRTLQVTMDQERRIYQQFRTRLAARADIRAMTDAQKQEAAELLATLFGINFDMYMQGIDAKNYRVAQQGRDMARQGLEKLLGVPIDSIRISSSGLTP
jgi:hypothetical protein